MSFRILDLPQELRDLIYAHIITSPVARLHTFPLPPPPDPPLDILHSGPQLRRDFIPAFAKNHSINLSLCRLFRQATYDWLETFGHVLVNEATHFSIESSALREFKGWIPQANLHIGLGANAVAKAPPLHETSGSARVGMAYVVFSAFARDSQYSTNVAMQIATAANNFMASRGDDTARITLDELKQLVGLLDDIHAIRLGGTGWLEEWKTDHIEGGAVTDFWGMVE